MSELPEVARSELGASGSPLVVVGVDGSRSGRAALRVAAQRARVLGARLLGVHVPPPTPVLWSMSVALAGQAVQWRDDVEETAFFDTAEAAGQAEVEWDFTVDSGDVAAVLARQARWRHADLLVVAAGARHRRLHCCPARRLTAVGDVPVLVAVAGTAGRDDGSR